MAFSLWNWLKERPTKIKAIYEHNPTLPETSLNVKFPWWLPRPLFWISLFVFFVIICLFAVATAGYELVPIVTTSWADTNTFWFNGFLPVSYRTQTRICGAHAFRIGDS